eukprot:scaffold27896_cov21-Tisochrysis_lutea.AAC.1
MCVNDHIALLQFFVGLEDLAASEPLTEGERYNLPLIPLRGCVQCKAWPSSQVLESVFASFNAYIPPRRS